MASEVLFGVIQKHATRTRKRIAQEATRKKSNTTKNRLFKKDFQEA
jgi:hypothetical protein